MDLRLILWLLLVGENLVWIEVVSWGNGITISNRQLLLLLIISGKIRIILMFLNGRNRVIGRSCSTSQFNVRSNHKGI